MGQRHEEGVLHSVSSQPQVGQWLGGRVKVAGRYVMLNFAPPFTKCFAYVTYLVLNLC